MKGKIIVWHRHVLKSISISILVAFIVLECSSSIAMPGRTVTNSQHSSQSQLIKKPWLVEVPHQYVALKDFHAGTNNKLVIHIQDAHANFSGQKNLASALEQLIANYGASRIFMEGGSQEVTLDDLKSIADQKTWGIVANQLLYKSLITGPEYLNLTSNHAMQLIGIEDKQLYDKNLKAFSDIVGKRQKVFSHLRRVQSSLNRLKYKFYPRELLLYEENKKVNSEGNQTFSSSIDSLLQLSEKAGLFDESEYGEIDKLKLLKNLELTIDFDALNQELESLLNVSAANNLHEFIREYKSKASNISINHVQQLNFLESINDKARSQGVSTEHLKALTMYRKYLRLFGDLNIDKLMNELELMEDRLYGGLLEDDQIKKIRAVDKYVELLKKGFSIKLSSREFKMIDVNKPIFKSDLWIDYLNRTLEGLGYSDDVIKHNTIIENSYPLIKSFYSLVQARDDAFMKNIDRTLKEEEQGIAFLVSGGYHTENLTSILKKNGYSYLVLSPHIDHKTNSDLYESVLMDDEFLGADDKNLLTEDQNFKNSYLVQRPLKEAGASRMSKVGDVAGSRLDASKLGKLIRGAIKQTGEFESTESGVQGSRASTKNELLPGRWKAFLWPVIALVAILVYTSMAHRIEQRRAKNDAAERIEAKSSFLIWYWTSLIHFAEQNLNKEISSKNYLRIKEILNDISTQWNSYLQDLEILDRELSNNEKIFNERLQGAMDQMKQLRLDRLRLAEVSQEVHQMKDRINEAQEMADTSLLFEIKDRLKKLIIDLDKYSNTDDAEIAEEIELQAVILMEGLEKDEAMLMMDESPAWLSGETKELDEQLRDKIDYAFNLPPDTVTNRRKMIDTWREVKEDLAILQATVRVNPTSIFAKTLPELEEASAKLKEKIQPTFEDIQAMLALASDVVSPDNAYKAIDPKNDNHYFDEVHPALAVNLLYWAEGFMKDANGDSLYLGTILEPASGTTELSEEMMVPGLLWIVNQYTNKLDHIHYLYYIPDGKDILKYGAIDVEKRGEKRGNAGIKGAVYQGLGAIIERLRAQRAKDDEENIAVLGEEGPQAESERDKQAVIEWHMQSRLKSKWNQIPRSKDFEDPQARQEYMLAQAIMHGRARPPGRSDLALERMFDFVEDRNNVFYGELGILRRLSLLEGGQDFEMYVDGLVEVIHRATFVGDKSYTDYDPSVWYDPAHFRIVYSQVAGHQFSAGTIIEGATHKKIKTNRALFSLPKGKRPNKPIYLHRDLRIPQKKPPRGSRLAEFPITIPSNIPEGVQPKTEEQINQMYQGLEDIGDGDAWATDKHPTYLGNDEWVAKTLRAPSKELWPLELMRGLDVYTDDERRASFKKELERWRDFADHMSALSNEMKVLEFIQSQSSDMHADYPVVLGTIGADELEEVSALLHSYLYWIAEKKGFLHEVLTYDGEFDPSKYSWEKKVDGKPKYEALRQYLPGTSSNLRIEDLDLRVKRIADGQRAVLFETRVQGEDSRVYMQRKRWLSSTLRMLHHNVSSTYEMHNRGIAHRDMKPENIFADAEKGAATFIDFGSSTQFNIDDDVITTHSLFEDSLVSPLYFVLEPAEISSKGRVHQYKFHDRAALAITSAQALNIDIEELSKEQKGALWDRNTVLPALIKAIQDSSELNIQNQQKLIDLINILMGDEEEKSLEAAYHHIHNWFMELETEGQGLEDFQLESHPQSATLMAGSRLSQNPSVPDLRYPDEVQVFYDNEDPYQGVPALFKFAQALNQEGDRYARVGVFKYEIYDGKGFYIYTPKGKKGAIDPAFNHLDRTSDSRKEGHGVHYQLYDQAKLESYFIPELATSDQVPGSYADLVQERDVLVVGEGKSLVESGAFLYSYANNAKFDDVRTPRRVVSSDLDLQNTIAKLKIWVGLDPYYREKIDISRDDVTDSRLSDEGYEFALVKAKGVIRNELYGRDADDRLLTIFASLYQIMEEGGVIIGGRSDVDLPGSSEYKSSVLELFDELISTKKSRFGLIARPSSEIPDSFLHAMKLLRGSRFSQPGSFDVLKGVPHKKPKALILDWDGTVSDMLDEVVEIQYDVIAEIWFGENWRKNPPVIPIEGRDPLVGQQSIGWIEGKSKAFFWRTVGMTDYLRFDQALKEWKQVEGAKKSPHDAEFFYSKRYNPEVEQHVIEHLDDWKSEVKAAMTGEEFNGEKNLIPYILKLVLAVNYMEIPVYIVTGNSVLVPHKIIEKFGLDNHITDVYGGTGIDEFSKEESFRKILKRINWKEGDGPIVSIGDGSGELQVANKINEEKNPEGRPELNRFYPIAFAGLEEKETRLMKDNPHAIIRADYRNYDSIIETFFKIDEESNHDQASNENASRFAEEEKLWIEDNESLIESTRKAFDDLRPLIINEKQTEIHRTTNEILRQFLTQVQIRNYKASSKDERITFKIARGTLFTRYYMYNSSNQKIGEIGFPGNSSLNSILRIPIKLDIAPAYQNQLIATQLVAILRESVPLDFPVEIVGEKLINDATLVGIVRGLQNAYPGDRQFFSRQINSIVSDYELKQERRRKKIAGEDSIFFRLFRSKDKVIPVVDLTDYDRSQLRSVVVRAVRNRLYPSDGDLQRTHIGRILSKFGSNIFLDYSSKQDSLKISSFLLKGNRMSMASRLAGLGDELKQGFIENPDWINFEGDEVPPNIESIERDHKHHYVWFGRKVDKFRITTSEGSSRVIYAKYYGPEVRDKPRQIEAEHSKQQTINKFSSAIGVLAGRSKVIEFNGRKILLTEEALGGQGVSLEEWQKPLEDRHITFIAQGLHELHRISTYQDIKFEHVFIREDDRDQLSIEFIDFGMATILYDYEDERAVTLDHETMVDERIEDRDELINALEGKFSDSYVGNGIRAAFERGYPENAVNNALEKYIVERVVMPQAASRLADFGDELKRGFVENPDWINFEGGEGALRIQSVNRDDDSRYTWVERTTDKFEILTADGKKRIIFAKYYKPDAEDKSVAFEDEHTKQQIIQKFDSAVGRLAGRSKVITFNGRRVLLQESALDGEGVSLHERNEPLQDQHITFIAQGLRELHRIALHKDVGLKHIFLNEDADNNLSIQFIDYGKSKIVPGFSRNDAIVVNPDIVARVRKKDRDDLLEALMNGKFVPMYEGNDLRAAFERGYPEEAINDAIEYDLIDEERIGDAASRLSDSIIERLILVPIFGLKKAYAAMKNPRLFWRSGESTQVSKARLVESKDLSNSKELKDSLDKLETVISNLGEEPYLVVFDLSKSPAKGFYRNAMRRMSQLLDQSDRLYTTVIDSGDVNEQAKIAAMHTGIDSKNVIVLKSPYNKQSISSFRTLSMSSQPVAGKNYFDPIAWVGLGVSILKKDAQKASLFYAKLTGDPRILTEEEMEGLYIVDVVLKPLLNRGIQFLKLVKEHVLTSA